MRPIGKLARLFHGHLRDDFIRSFKYLLNPGVRRQQGEYAWGRSDPACEDERGLIAAKVLEICYLLAHEEDFTRRSVNPISGRI